MFRQRCMKKLEKSLSELKGLFGLARKAGYVIVGLENLREYDKKLYALVVDEICGKSLNREMEFLAKKRNLPLARTKNLAELVDIENCKAVGIKNKGLADAILEKLKDI